MSLTPKTIHDSELLSDVSTLFCDGREQATQHLNAELTLLYWRVGQRISVAVLGRERASYAKQVIAGLAKDLASTHGRGWSAKHLRHCQRFFEVFGDEAIVYALRRQLSWTHLPTLTYLNDGLKREFYTQMAVQERWSTRTLNERIDS